MLYIVGTPIGNLEDLSLRQARIIVETPILLCEDTRSTGMLIQHIERTLPLKRVANQRLISYYKDKEFEKLPEVMDLLETGVDMALISQNGMPLISDPGYLLVKQAIHDQIPYTVVPGPTAVTTALVASGFKPTEFMYLGFLPRKKNEILRSIDRSKSVSELFPNTVFVWYESPNRLKQTLEVFNEAIPAAKLCIARELSKKFEEIIHGTAEELMEREYKGEIVLLFTYS